MYFYKKVEIDIFFKYSDFGQGESTLMVYFVEDWKKRKLKLKTCLYMTSIWIPNFQQWIQTFFTRFDWKARQLVSGHYFGIVVYYGM